MTYRLTAEEVAANVAYVDEHAMFGHTVTQGAWQLVKAHITAQQAEIDRLEGQVAALRQELIYLGFHGLDHHPDCDGDDDCFCQRLDALADTETAAKAHDQRERLAGAREFARRWNDEMEASSRNPFTVLDVLADMEREAADGR